MFDPKSLDHLGPIADEMLGGLHADEAMRLRIMRAARDGAKKKKSPVVRFAPAVCCAALALVCVGAAGFRLGRQAPKHAGAGVMTRSGANPVQVETIAAGNGPAALSGELVAGLGSGARVRSGSAGGESLFASASGDIPLVAVGGGVYRLLEKPADIGASQLGRSLGSIRMHTGEPSLAAADAFAAGLSNVVKEGAEIFCVGGLAGSTAVAAEVDGRMRMFQRVSYAGRGPGGEKLEDTFSVRGKVKEMTLSGVGTIAGDKANEAAAVLLDYAVLKSADADARGQTLTVTLTSGLKLQLGVSGDTLCGCGSWSCPEFFEAFEAAL